MSSASLRRTPHLMSPLTRMLLQGVAISMSAALFSACGSSSSSPIPSDTSSPTIPATALGAPCTPVDTCPACANTAPTDVCTQGYCATEGKAGEAGYCSARCDEAACPDGYECRPAKVTQVVNPERPLATKICFRKAASSPSDGGADSGMPRCGDGTIDPGEACDDGNLVDEDACTRDCKTANPARVALKLSWGRQDAVGRPRPFKADVNLRVPSPGDANGCGGADAVSDPNPNIIRLRFTLCAPKPGGQMEMMDVEMPIPRSGDITGGLPLDTHRAVVFVDMDGRQDLIADAQSNSERFVARAEGSVQGGRGVKGTLSAPFRLRGLGVLYGFEGELEIVPRAQP